jgi:hypothetical protein
MIAACDTQPTTPPGQTSDTQAPDADAQDDATATHPGFVEVFDSPAPAATLEGAALLTRLSLDLRGTRPSPDELARLEATPGEATLGAIVDAMLQDARFGKRVRDLFASVLRTRVEDFPVGAAALGLDPADEGELFQSIGEEPLELIARVATEDRPWTDLVTADWTMADETLGAIYPVERQAGPGWQPARYADGRPAAGVLATNGLWWRYLSDGVSYGRGRANAVARIFLCADFLNRPVDFPRDIDLTDEAGIRAAVRENAGCIGCHVALDPLASYLAGFQYTDKTASELVAYHPERERQWRVMTALAPAYYGTAGYTLGDLGRQIAADPRFVTCAVETTYELLVRKKVDPTDRAELDALTRHREAFLAGGLTLRALVRSIVGDPRYREGPGGAGHGERVVTPEQWGDVLQDLTGYRLQEGGVDLLTTDLSGLRTLAGGGDGRAGAEPASLATTTMVLTWRRTAEAAARYAVQEPVRPPAAAALFTVSLDAPPTPPAAKAVEDPAMRAQVATLFLRIFGTRVADDGLEVRATLALWDQLARIDGPREAWAGVLTALLRDPSLTLY